MDSLSGRVAARFLADRVATDDDVNVQKLERLIDAMEKEVKQMNTSLGLYKKDPGKYKPQLDNLTNSASSVRSAVNVILRMFGD